MKAEEYKGEKYTHRGTPSHTYVKWLESKLQQERKEVKELLEHIIEYWNGDRNDMAMHNALCHILDECDNYLLTQNKNDDNSDIHN